MASNKAQVSGGSVKAIPPELPVTTPGSSDNNIRPGPLPPAPTAAGGDQGRRGEFWSQLKIEVGTFNRLLPPWILSQKAKQPAASHPPVCNIPRTQIDPQYAPEWHPESSEATSSVIPAQISDSPSEADTNMTEVVESGGEAFALPPARLPLRPELWIAKWIGLGLSGALVLLGLAHQAVELAMYAQLRIASSWWAGLLCVLIGAFGLSPWSCLHTYHDALAVCAILLNAVAAVLDMRTRAMLRDTSLRCGGASDAVVAMTVGEWCALDQRRGGRGRYNCGCIIPGAEPGAPDSCLAFHGQPSAGGCDAGAHTLAGLVSTTAILCWTLAAICLVASVARVMSACYRQRRCPGCLVVRGKKPEESVPPYLRNNNSAKAAMPTGGSGRAMVGEREEGQRQPRAQMPGRKPPPPYALRDCPGGQA